MQAKHVSFKYSSILCRETFKYSLQGLFKYSLLGDAMALSLAVWEESSLGAMVLASSLCLEWGGRNLHGSLNFDGRRLRGSLNGRNPSDLHGSSNWEQHGELKNYDCSGAPQDGCSGCGEN